MNKLEEIVGRKKIDVAGAKRNTPIEQLEQSPLFSRKPISLKASIQQQSSPAIIAEFKRRSPSRGEINSNVTPTQVAQGYQKAGATGMSVLTRCRGFWWLKPRPYYGKAACTATCVAQRIYY